MARWSPLALVIGLLAAVGLYGATAASAAVPLTVATAIASQDGTTRTVRGYVVGQPTAANTVIRSGFPDDNALALAEYASETNTSKMLYVQITTAFRSSWGLSSNPSLVGRQIDVTGTLTPYFSPHAGLKSPTAIVFSGTTPPPSSSTTTTPPTTSTTTPPSTCEAYYTAACGKSGTALKSALNTIISSNQTKLSYDAVWEALKVTDQDPDNSNNVILLYSGISRAKSANGGGNDNWNREHVWAKSHGDFGTATGPGTDLHHLRPEDVNVNATRGNLDFDLGGSPVPEASFSKYDSDSFEPRSEVKGDVARMIFYMAVRYEGNDGFPNLEVNDAVNNGTAPYMGRLSVLKTWSRQDPPDSFERDRNEVIYKQFQHNRNPFIDHPEWVSSIWP